MWNTPPAGLAFEPLFLAATDACGLPEGLLSRVAYQESGYNPDAYNASSGASGIMQIVPRWHPGVNPWDPAEAIPYAASYLRQNFERFGDWGLALAAYNAGPGNVTKYGGVPPFPETVNYVRNVLADVGAAIATAAGKAPARTGAGFLLLLGLLLYSRRKR